MIILDVREMEEFEAEHVPNSIWCPLSQFDLLAPGILKNIKDSDILVMCRSGKRAQMAIGELDKFDFHQHKCSPFEGGLIQWKKEGKPVATKGSAFPIMRQFQIVASTLIFTAFILAKLIAPDFVYLALFVGFGLALAGYTGFCPMVNFLQKMPWNKKKKESASTSDKPSCCS